MSDTPRTDAVDSEAEALTVYGALKLHRENGRALERENAQLKAELAVLRSREEA